jgi:hypothetical protein
MTFPNPKNDGVFENQYGPYAPAHHAERGVNPPPTAETADKDTTPQGPQVPPKEGT